MTHHQDCKFETRCLDCHSFTTKTNGYGALWHAKDCKSRRVEAVVVCHPDCKVGKNAADPKPGVE